MSSTVLPPPANGDNDNTPLPFGISEDLVLSPTHKPAATSSIDFDGLLRPPLVLHEDLREGNGGQVWPAGMLLAKYLLRVRRKEICEATSIVELGAGGGLVGLSLAAANHQASARQQQQPIYITDQPAMVPLMQRNIALNNLPSTAIHASAYVWGTPRPAHIPATPTIILAADCVYFEPAFPLLLQTLEELLGPAESSTCYLCFKRRRRADLGFVKMARRRFEVCDVLDDPAREEWMKERMFLYTIRKKRIPS